MNTLILLALGGLLGVVGQGIRVLAGLRKLSESKKSSPNEFFDKQRLTISLLLGFIAGALGIISLMDEKGTLEITKTALMTVVGLGYAGVDFIEAFLTKYQIIPSAKDDLVKESKNEPLAKTTMTSPPLQRAALPYASK